MTRLHNTFRLSQWLVLATGLIVLLTVVISLQLLFLQEAKEDRSRLTRETTIAQGAVLDAIENYLDDRWQLAKIELAESREQPVYWTGDLLYVQQGTQTLPPTFQATAAATTPLYNQYQRLLEARRPIPVSNTETGPASMRTQLMGKLFNAIDIEDKTQITQAYRELAIHRAAFQQPVNMELPQRLATIAKLHQDAKPTRALMAAEIKDGLPVAELQTTIPPLRQILLDHRGAMSDLDFRRLTMALDEISADYAFWDSAWEAMQKLESQELAVPAALTEPTFIEHGEWYVKPTEPGDLLGFRVNWSELADRAKAVADNLKIEFKGFRPTGLQDFTSTQVHLLIDAPRWRDQARQIDQRLRYKTGLNILCVALFVLAIAMLVWNQRRRQQFLDLKADFVAAVSHELKTPLASMRLQAETLQRRLNDASEFQRYPDRIIRDVDGMTQLVENILSFNRFGQGRINLVKTSQSLMETVNNAVIQVQSSTERPLKLIASRELDIEFNADHQLLTVLFANLLRNATQYNQAQKACVEIDVYRDDPLRIRVGDNGIGIREENWHSVFEPFYRGKENMARGSGLGLALCQTIAELHGGSIRIVESGPEGTTLEIELAHVENPA